MSFHLPVPPAKVKILMGICQKYDDVIYLFLSKRSKMVIARTIVIDFEKGRCFCQERGNFLC
jgi:hypothetical protein